MPCVAARSTGIRIIYKHQNDNVDREAETFESEDQEQSLKRVIDVLMDIELELGYNN
jgi:hypothetical protein